MTRVQDILITRDAAGNAELAELLSAKGFAVTRWDAFASQPLPVADWRGLIQNQDWLVFTSATAARFFFAHNAPSDCLHLRVACVGDKTAAAVRECGAIVSLVSRRQTSAGLAEEDVFKNSAGLKILLPQAQDGRDDFAQALAAQHQITRIAHYQKKFFPLPAAIRTKILSGHFQLVLFYSPSVVRHFFQQLSDERDALKNLAIGVIGTTTAQEVVRHGLAVQFCAGSSTADLLQNLD